MPADGHRRQRRSDPVEVAGGVLVTAFRDVSQRVQREEDEGNVDQEDRPPADAVDQHPADERPEDRGARGRAGPDAECPSLLLALEVGGQQRQRAGDQQRPKGSLDDARHDQELHVRRQPAKHRRRAEPRGANGEHATPAIEVGHCPGQDEE
jgi:hypothetical protein